MEIRNLFGMRSGGGKPAPGLKNVVAGGERIHIAGDGALELAGKPFTVERTGDGQWNVQINARSPEHVAKLVPHIAAAIGIPEARFAEQLLAAEGKMVVRRPAPIVTTPSFGGPEAIRSMVKSALVLWATRVGDAEVASPRYEAARAFVAHGNAIFNLESTHLDSRCFVEVERMTGSYGPAFNMIYVRSNATGRVLGHFTLYNLVGWQFTLADGGASPDRKVGLVSNPLDPLVWSASAADEFDVPFAWLDAPDYSDELSRSKARLVALMQHYVATGEPKAVATIFDEVREKMGFDPDQPLSADQAEDLLKKVADRVARHTLDIPYEEALSMAEVARFLAKD